MCLFLERGAISPHPIQCRREVRILERGRLVHVPLAQLLSQARLVHMERLHHCACASAPEESHLYFIDCVAGYKSFSVKLILPQDFDVIAALCAAFVVAILISYVFHAAFFSSISRSL